MPDIAVLVHHPSLSMMEVAERGLYFLKNGSSLVWILHPDSSSVDVCTRSPKKSFRVYKVPQGGSLNGGDVLPGLTLDINELFGLDKTADATQTSETTSTSGNSSAVDSTGTSSS
jgi:Uma2 family endonuclease